MKFKSLILMSIISLFASANVLAADSTTTPTTDNSAQQSVPSISNPTTQATNNNKDGAVIATLIILNKNEIAVAKLAAKKQVAPEVKKYANFLSQAHSKNLSDTIKLSKKIKESPDQTDDVKALQQDGKQEIASLESLNGPQFSVAFIDDMVKDHQAALNKIDNTLLPNVDNPKLKKHLEATRQAISKHLEMAQKIQSQLQNSNTSSTSDTSSNSNASTTNGSSTQNSNS